MKLTIPFPPSINSYWQQRKGGRGVFVSPEGKRFQTDVLALVLSTFGKPTPIAGDVAVSIKLYPPDHRRSDIDNRVKVALDALQNAGVYINDYQVAKLTIERCEVRKPGGAAEVVVEALA